MARHVEDLLSAYLDQELNDVEREQVENHLNQCLECRNELEALTALQSQLALAYESVETPDGFESIVMERIESRGRASQKAATVRNWGMVAIAALLIVALFSQVAPVFYFGASMASVVMNISYRLLHVVSLIISSAPYALGIVFASAVVLIILSLWSLHRLLETRTIS